MSQIKDQIKQQQNKVIPSIQGQQQSIETVVINYPDKISSYNTNTDTIISFQGKKYKCKSNLEVKFCNDKAIWLSCLKLYN